MSSFKDYDTIVFKDNGTTYRQINQSYAKHFEKLMQSGLYHSLVEKGLLITHEETKEIILNKERYYTSIKPEQLSFVAHPAEWSFLQWQDAALCTLQTLEASIAHGMILKDATPFNVQMHKGKMKWIDTGSFVIYENQQPWLAYKQFCETFLAPILLMSFNYADAGKLFALYPNGIPIKQLTRLLPFKARFNFSILKHVYFQASFKGSEKKDNTQHKLKQQNLTAIIDSLKTLIKNLEGRFVNFDWDLYYQSIWIEEDYLTEKTIVFKSYLSSLNVKSAVDLGCNTGYFSEIMAQQNMSVIAVDSSSSSIDQLFEKIKSEVLVSISCCTQDIINPTPASGILLNEKSSFFSRAKSDLVVALALIHHFSLTNNGTFNQFAETLATLGDWAITEFVPKSDSNVKLMLKNSEDIFHEYDETHFEQAIKNHFRIAEKNVLKNGRILYLLQKP